MNMGYRNVNSAKYGNSPFGPLFGVAAAAFVLIIGPSSAQSFEAERVVSGLTRPLFVASPAGDADRLFVVQQSGEILIIENDVLIATPFLDLSTEVNFAGERGLLGLAFHPNYLSNGFFYVNYIDLDGNDDTVVERFTVSGDPNVADIDSRLEILRFAQPFANHNGGCMAFGPLDGYLYIASGDGGSGNDPQNNGQSLDTLLGKMLRIDVDGGTPYAIPPDNPFVGVAGAEEEIWTYGLRNPWRFSFDRLTGDMYIGDVGQNVIEEISFQAGSSLGGENFGWRIAEGFECRGGGGTCGTNPGFTPPILDYDHSIGTSVTGGYVYRGSAIPGLQGTYFFADFVASRIWSLEYDGVSVSNFTELTGTLTSYNGGILNSFSSFGEDDAGELYICDFGGGEVYRIVSLDKDNDGLTNSEELALGTDPGNSDTDNDGLTDGDEVNIHGTDPLNWDTDGDFFSDGLEVGNGSDPLDGGSVPALNALTEPGAIILVVFLMCAAMAALFASRKQRTGIDP